MKPFRAWSLRHKIQVPALGILIVILGAVLYPYGRAFYGYLEIGFETQAPKQFEGGRLLVKDDLPILLLKGSHREMGLQYGALLRRSLLGISSLFRVALSAEKRAEYIDYAQAHESLLPSWAREELRAMSDASGMPYLELVALNIVPKMSCSGLFAKRAGGGTIFGRNADYFSLGFSDRGMLVVVFQPDEGLPVASVGFIGMIGSYTGMNEQGVSWGNMLVFNAKENGVRDDGLPIALVLRAAGESNSAAESFARNVAAAAPAIPINVMVADGANGVTIQQGLRAAKIQQSNDAALALSNFFLSPELGSRPPECPRRKALLRAAEKAGAAGMTVAEMEAALLASIIPGLNVQAVVFEPDRRRMHVSINKNPAAAGPFVTLDGGELFAGS